MPNWTDEQKNAIEVRNKNVLVSAAAGSGKTAVLVERVIRLITDRENPVGLDRLLVVTFTNAAAAEMRSRISVSLNKLIKDNPNDNYYRRQLSMLPNAKICTIDSFCSSLVKEHFFDLSINQDFNTFDESELQLLEDSVISEVLDSFFEEGDSDFISLFELFTTPSNEKPVISVIKKLLRFIYAQPFPYKWLEDVTELYNPEVPFKNSVWYDYVIKEIKYLAHCALSIAKDNLKIIDSDDSDTVNKFTELVKDDIKQIENYIAMTDEPWDNLIAAGLPKFANSPRTTKLEPSSAEKFKATRNNYKSIFKDDIATFYVCDEADYTEDMKILYNQLKMLIRLVKETDNRLLEQKRELNTYSFADIEHFAINLLFRLNDKGEVEKTELADNLSSQFFEILVDEYQDTNEAQDLLFSYLSKGNNLFTVGDIKQSIYRFRLAMPHIFNHRKKTYSYYKKDCKDNSVKIILDKNFRSRKDICAYVNFVFSNLMSERVGELNYNSDEYLNNGAKYDDQPIPSAQIKILTGIKGDEYDKSEATYIAHTIIEKVNSGELIKDGDNYRPIRYGDFAILMRKVRGHIDTYSQVLTEMGIPVICNNTSNLFESNEIRILLSFIRVIDNPMQDIPLLSVMMSPMYGFTPDELAEIRIESNTKSFYNSVVLSKSQKAVNFINDIKSLKSISVTISVASFIRYLIEDKGLIAYINAMGNGEQRYQNILKLISFAKKFDSGVNIGLTAFVRYIDKISKSDNGMESANIAASGDNAVKIMSIHKSKGLEFPICIFAGSTRQYNTLDLREKLLLNTNLGIGVKCHNEGKMYQYNTMPYTVIRDKNSTELMSENLRVLYVAMTRAKEQFITFITVDDINKKAEKLACNISNSSISDYFCRKINNDGDLLLTCALLHGDKTPLDDIVSCNIKKQMTDFPLSVEITDKIELVNRENETDFVPPQEEVIAQIENKLSYSYDRLSLSSLSAKLTASSLDHADNSFEYITSSKPAFLNKSGLTPAQRGTAMHTFMQFCDYECSRSNLEREIERLNSLGHLSDDQAQSLDRTKLTKFFSSSFADEIFSADKVYREIKVSSFVSTKDVYNTDFDEKVLIQGIADCVIEKDGMLTLIDYKTDNVKDEQELLERYKKQIMFYKSAISKTLKKPVKNALLYSFKLGKCCYYK